MSTSATIPQAEYKQLKRQSAAYRRLAAKIFESIMEDDVTAVVQDFAATKKYSTEFLTDLKEGLSRSSYGRA